MSPYWFANVPLLVRLSPYWFAKLSILDIDVVVDELELGVFHVQIKPATNGGTTSAKME